MLRRFVLTGAPGAGKTALAVALRDRGYLIVAEAATDVIADEHARGIDEHGETEGFWTTSFVCSASASASGT